MDDLWRSPVPDLLFEDEQDTRIAELGGLVDEPEAVTGQTPLHRVTIFLTYRCNLDCPYCKTIARSEAELVARPQKRLTWDLERFERYLDEHEGTPIRHLHFTGGEATLLRTLPQMIRSAKARGVEQVSVTTNGTLSPQRYLELIDAGLDEVRVSIDAADPSLGEAMTGRTHAWSRAVETLAALGRARREGRRFFLIVNTVVGAANRGQLPELVSFLLALGPDDLKLITDVDQRDGLGSFPGALDVTRRLREVLANFAPAAFPLLRRKLKTVFARDAIGLEHLPPTEGWRCFVPLTERTVDGASYYPCSVYLREGGTPLGPLSDSQEVQRANSARFAREGACQSDPLCRKYCLHCTTTYNVRANGARR